MKLLLLLIMPVILIGNTNEHESMNTPLIPSFNYDLSFIETIQLLELKDSPSKVEFTFVCKKSSGKKGFLGFQRLFHVFRLWIPLIKEDVFYESKEAKAIKRAIVGTKITVTHLEMDKLLFEHTITKVRDSIDSYGRKPVYWIPYRPSLKKGQTYKVEIELPPKGNSKAEYQILELAIGLERGDYL